MRCANCRITWLGTPDDDAIVEDFVAHMLGHNIAAGAPSPAAAPFPVTHGPRVPVERGTFARPADGVDPARHPSAGRRLGGGGVA